MSEVAADKETVILDSVFATSPDGRIFEIPTAEADKLEVSMEREAELGHLPIFPYTVLTEPEGDLVGADSEVEGHHMSRTPCGQYYWHTYACYGSYRNRCGHTVCGWHYHPYGSCLGVPCSGGH